jgi:TPP-dependent pyruvate/acetoin dehydrogenase alpha subunit
VHLSIGQEAVSAGVCCALHKTDRIYGTYRGHGIFIAKGGELRKMFAELYGKDTGCARGKGGSMHLVAPEVGLMGCSAIVASTIPVATGDALASQMQGRSRVVVSLFGDGAVDEGVFFESVNFAALKGLPIIFVCENNAYAIHSRISDRHKQTDLYRYGESLGVAGHRHDGNDVYTVYLTMAQAVESIRNGGPPVLLEYTTYRWQEHVGPGIDYHEAYRDPKEVSQALDNDPLKRAKSKLKEAFKIPEEMFETWEQSILQEIEEAVEFAETSPFPGLDRLHADLYEERE